MVLILLISATQTVNAKALLACEGCKERNRIPVNTTASEGRVVRPEVNFDMSSGFQPTEPIAYEHVTGVARDTQCLWVGPQNLGVGIY